MEMPSFDELVNRYYATITSEHPEIELTFPLYARAVLDILVLDETGQVVATIANDLPLPEGFQTITWNGLNSRGQEAAGGTYTVAFLDHEDHTKSYYSIELILDREAPEAYLTGVFLRDYDFDGKAEVRIKGTVQDEHLRYYQVKLACGFEEEEKHAAVYFGEVTDDILAEFEIEDDPNVPFTAHLLAIDETGLLTEDSLAGNFRLSLNGLKVYVEEISQEVAIGNTQAKNYPDSPEVWIDESMPANAILPIDNWIWHNGLRQSGKVSHTDNGGLGFHYHYFICPDQGLLLENNTNIIQYVYLDPTQTPDMILLQFYTDVGDGEHRAFFGNYHAFGGVLGTESMYYMDEMMPAGQWVRLKIPAANLGLEGEVVKGMLFATYGGRAYWDKTTTSNGLNDHEEGSYAIMQQGEDNTSPTSVKYSVNKEAWLTFKILDDQNNPIRTMYENAVHTPGHVYQVNWDNLDDWGQIVGDGVYDFEFSSSQEALEADIIKYQEFFPTTGLPGTKYPLWLELTPDGSVYIIYQADTLIYKYAANGGLLYSLNIGGLPSHLEVDSQGNLYVVDSLRHRVLKYDPQGGLLLQIGSYGSGEGEFIVPIDLALGKDGQIYVLDSQNMRVEQFTPSGDYIDSVWLVADNPATEAVEGPDFVSDSLSSLEVDSRGFLYIVDPFSQALFKYNPSGEFVKTIGEFGSKPGSFNGPIEVCCDLNDHLYVSERGNGRIQKIDHNGSVLAVLDQPYPVIPCGLSLDREGDLWVADYGQQAIEQFKVGRGEFELNSIVADIFAPWEDSLVGGWVSVQGTASAQNFDHYTVEYGRGTNPTEWIPAITSYTEKDNQYYFSGHAIFSNEINSYLTVLCLGEGGWDGGWGVKSTGDYTVKLTVYNQNGESKEDRQYFTWGGIINPGGGGTVIGLDEKIYLDVPPFAFSGEGLLVSLIPTDEPKLKEHDYMAITPYYAVRPEAQRFNVPATLRILYDEEALDRDKNGVVDVDERKLAVYRWNPVLGIFEHAGGIIDTTINQISLDIFEIPPYEAYYVVFYRNIELPAPYLYQPATPTEKRIISVEGTSEKGMEVMIYVNGRYQSSTKADPYSGYFYHDRIILRTGQNEVTARARDVLDNFSDQTEPLEVLSELSQPRRVRCLFREGATSSTSLFFMKDDYSAELEGAVHIGDRLYLEYKGVDADPQQMGEVFIILSSPLHDPDGFLVVLDETGLQTGIFRSEAMVGTESDSGQGIIGALNKVRIEVEEDPNIWDEIEVEDNTPPQAPVITSATHPSLCQNTFEGCEGCESFENAFDEWENRTGEAGGFLSLDTTDPWAGSSCLKVLNKNEGGDMAVRIRSSQYDVAEYPMVSFAYKIPANVRINLMVSIDEVWYEIALTDEVKNLTNFDDYFYRNIGSLPVVADGQWHELEFNLFNLLTNAVPDQEEFIVDEMIMGDWDIIEWAQLGMGSNPAGAVYYIDNFVIGTVGSASDPQLSWPGLADLSGIMNYSYLLDNQPDTLPDETGEGTATQVTITQPEEGLLYFHCRAQDGAGNWGLAGHYRLKVDRTGPLADSPIPGINEITENTEIRLHLSDSGGTGVDGSTIKMMVENQLFDSNCGGLSYDPVTETVILRLWQVTSFTPLPIVDQQIIDVGLIEAKDLAGNDLVETYSWSWQADYTKITEGTLVLLTTGGGTQASPNSQGTKVAFTSKRSGNQDIWVIDLDDLAEAKNTAKALTTHTRADYQPAWSPVDNRIVFVSERGGSQDIWSIKADGTGLTQLTRDDGATVYQDSHPTWSPDGSQIAFSRGSDIWVMTDEGLDLHPITNNTVETNCEPEWSFDGRKITFRKSLYADHLFVMDNDGTDEIQVTEEDNTFSPSFTNSGEAILYDYEDAIYTARLDGSEKKKFLDNQSKWHDRHPKVVPGQETMVFESTRNGAWNLWLLSLLGVEKVKTDTPAFSPNGDGLTDTVTLSYRLPTDNLFITIEVLEEDGDLVKQLVKDQRQSSGDHSLVFNGQNSSGQLSPEGRYQIRVKASLTEGGQGVEETAGLVIDLGSPTSSLSFSQSYQANNTYYLTSQSTITLSAEDSKSEIASLVYSLDQGQTWLTYTAPFSLNQSLTLFYKAKDKAGNWELTKAAQCILDDQAPQSQIITQGPFYSTGQPDSTNYAGLATTYTFSGGADAGSGVDKTYYRLDADTGYSLFAAPLSFTTEGQHTISYYSVDNLGHTEQARDFSVIVDQTQPAVVTLTPDQELLVSGANTYAEAGTHYTLASQDTGSGLLEIVYKIDGAGFTTYTNPFTLALGVHELQYQAKDRVGNLSELQIFRVEVVQTLPDTRMITSKPLYTSGGVHYASLDTTYIFTSSYPAIMVKKDQAEFIEYTTPISFSQAGTHTLTYKGVNSGTGAQEPETSLEIVVDQAAANTTLQAGQPSYQASNEAAADIFITSQTNLSLLSSDNASGVKKVEYALDQTSQWTLYIGAFTLSASTGEHTLYWRSEDQVGNAEAQHSRGLVIDNSGPTITIQPSGSLINRNSQQYARGTFTYTLNAVDTGSGVAEISYKLNQADWTNYTQAFTLASDGLYTILYQAKDFLGQASSQGQLTVYADHSTPVSSLTADVAYLKDTNLYIKRASNLLLNADDGLGSGVQKIEYSFDQGASWQQYSKSFRITETSEQQVQYRSTDWVGNQEQTRLKTVIVDENTPTSSLATIGAASSQDLLYVLPTTQITLSSTDGNGSGVKRIEYKIGSTAWAIYGQGFSLTTPGLHHLYYRAMDNLSQVESSIARDVFVDIYPPETTCIPGSQVYDDGVNNYALVGTSFSLVAKDVGAGIAEITYSLDGQAMTQYTSPLTLSTKGTHTITYKAKDKVNNEEAVKTYNVLITDTLPLVALQVQGTIYVAGDGTKYAPTTNTYLLSSTGLDPAIDGLVYKIDLGDFLDYTTPFNLTSFGPGAHQVSFAAKKEGNILSSSIYQLVIDANAPVTTLTIGNPQYGQSPLLITSSTTLTLAATDVGSGLAKIEYSLDQGNSWTTYSQPFTLSKTGAINLWYRGQDKVGNIEAYHQSALLVDNTAPQVWLTPSGVLTKLKGENYAPASYTYTITAQDQESGVASIQVRLDQSAWASYGGPLSLTSPGLHQIYYRAENNLGQKSTDQSFTVILAEGAALTTKLVPTKPIHQIANLNVSSPTCTYRLEVTGDKALLDRLEYRIDTGGNKTYSAPFSLSQAGEHTIYFRSLDTFGNQEPEKSYSLYVDATAPSIAQLQAYPNPFTPNSEINQGVGDQTEIHYTISDNLFETLATSMSITNTQGVLVRQLHQTATQASGTYTVTWDGQDDAGQFVLEGDYLCTLTVTDPVGNTTQETRTIVVTQFMVERLVAGGSGDQIQAKVYEQYIVFQDDSQGNWDIYLYDIEKDKTYQLTNDPNDQINPAIHGQLVAFEDYSQGAEAQICLYDLKAGKKFQITSEAREKKDPAVWAETIVWSEYLNNSWEIMSYHYTTGQMEQLTNRAGDQIKPDIYFSTLVYEDHHDNQSDIWVLDLLTGQEYQLVTDAAQQTHPAIYNRKVVWQDNRSGHWDIYVYDLLSGQTASLNELVPLQSVRDKLDGFDQTEPDLFGDLVVYQDNRRGSADMDIYLYNLNGEYEALITSQASRQESPAIYGQSIVWQDQRGGNWDIYQAVITQPSQSVTITTIPETDGAGEPSLYGHQLVFTDEVENFRHIYGFDLGSDLINQNKTILASIALSDQEKADRFANWVVYQDNRNGNYDLYLFDDANNLEIRLTTDLADQKNPSISHDLIVFEDYRSGDVDLWAYRISTGSTIPICEASGDQQKPCVFGEKVVYEDNRNGQWDIYLYDLAINTEQRLTDEVEDQTHPSIYDGRVVWQDRRHGQPEIYIYDLYSQKEDRLTFDAVAQTEPQIDDLLVVWKEGASLKAYNLVYHEIMALTTTQEAKGDLDLYQRKVVWQQVGNSLLVAEIKDQSLSQDNTPPQLTQTKVTPESISPNNQTSTGIKDTVIISGSLSDNQSPKLLLTGRVVRASDHQVVIAALANSQTVPTGPWQITWNGQNQQGTWAEDGQYVVEVTLVDESSNSAAYFSPAIKVDNASPSVSFTSPTDGLTIHNPRPVMAGIFSDQQPLSGGFFELMIDSASVPGSVTLTADGFAYTPTRDLQDGSHLLEATVVDCAGNLAYSSVAVNIDTQPSIESIHRDPNTGMVAVNWKGYEGRYYTIYYSDQGFEDGLAWRIAKGNAVGKAQDTFAEEPEADQRFYQILRTGQDPNQVGIIAGQYCLDLVEGMNMVSLPLIPYSSRLTDILSNQLTGADNPGDADRIWYWNLERLQYEYAWYSTEPSCMGWRSPATGWPEVDPNVISLDADKGFWIQIRTGHGPTSLCLLGEVSREDRQINLYPGMQLLGSSFPVEVSIHEANLRVTGGFSPGEADRLWYWNKARQQYEYAWYSIYPGWEGWRRPYDWAPADLIFRPGEGFWLQIRRNHNGLTWQYRKPRQIP